MLATAPRSRGKPLVGSPKPRIAPPTPVRAAVGPFRDRAAELGLTLYPWQETAARYLTAQNAQGHPLYREVAIVVARQNGKTRLLLPLIVEAMLAGKRVMHAAQSLRLPGEFHLELADVFESRYPELLPAKRGISFRAGQESIRLKAGGFYQIVAATGAAPRGPANQLVVVDEVRELTNTHFLAGIKPTMIAQPDAQIVYLSNAGTEESVVLNALRARAGADDRLAYLEWSAEPKRKADDLAGWVEANPSIGHNPVLLDNLTDEYRAAALGGTMADFETEHLCRWVESMKQLVVKPEEWAAQEFGDLGRSTRPVMAIKMDITGTRAAAVVAWLLPDKRVAVEVVADVSGDPIDVNRLGPDLVRKATEARAGIVGFDPYTDADLARFFRNTKAIGGRDYASASEGFARRVASTQFQVKDDAGAISADLAHTVRHNGQRGTWLAVKSGDDHTNTVAEAAIRAAWLASNPITTERSRIH